MLQLAVNPHSGRKEREKRLIIGAWNVHTLLDREDTPRPHRRTALVAKELSRYMIDIAALSETHFAEEGVICEPEGGYTFFWKGKPEQEDRPHGVSFAIHNALLRQIPGLPTGINEQQMKLRFPISRSRHITIISAYAPTLSSCDEDKETFYKNLDSLMKSTPANNKLVVLGDFNARVGADHQGWEGALGPQGAGKMNSNELLPLTMCTENSLTITNTLFRLANKHKTTWMHPRSKQ